MTEARVQRRLAAILAADIVGYSRLMGEDEEGTLARMKMLRHEVIVEAMSGEVLDRITILTGEPDAEHLAMYDACREALAACEATIRPGATMGDVFDFGKVFLDQLYSQLVDIHLLPGATSVGGDDVQELVPAPAAGQPNQPIMPVGVPVTVAL